MSQPAPPPLLSRCNFSLNHHSQSSLCRIGSAGRLPATHHCRGPARCECELARGSMASFMAARSAGDGEVTWPAPWVRASGSSKSKSFSAVLQSRRPGHCMCSLTRLAKKAMLESSALLDKCHAYLMPSSRASPHQMHGRLCACFLLFCAYPSITATAAYDGDGICIDASASQLRW